MGRFNGLQAYPLLIGTGKIGKPSRQISGREQGNAGPAASDRILEGDDSTLSCLTCGIAVGFRKRIASPAP
jgi:hypothetical protein